MLDASFVESIQVLAEKAVKPETIDIGGGRRVILVGGQVVQEFAKDNPLESLTVGNYASFVDAVKYLLEVDGQTIIKVMPSGLLAFIEPTKPHAKTTVILEFLLTEARQALSDWSMTPKSVSQVNKLLRTKLYGTFPDSLISVFRQVEFSRSGSTVVGKAAHRDTMGKSIDNAVKSAAGDLPEEIAFTVKQFQNVPNEDVQLRFFVETNAESESLKLCSIGDTVEVALQLIIGDLVYKLAREFPDALVVAG